MDTQLSLIKVLLHLRESFVSVFPCIFLPKNNLYDFIRFFFFLQKLDPAYTPDLKIQFSYFTKVFSLSVIKNPILLQYTETAAKL